MQSGVDINHQGPRSKFQRPLIGCKTLLSLFEGSLAQKLRFHIFHFHFLRDVSHKSFVFTSSTFTFWGMSRTKASVSHLPLSLREGCLAQSFVFTSSTFTFWGTSRTKASFSHLPLSLFEGCLAQKLRFHISHFRFLREVSRESFVFTSSTCSLWGTSRTKASFSHLPLADCEGSLARNPFLKVSGWTKCCVLQDKTCPGRWVGKLFRQVGAEHVQL